MKNKIIILGCALFTCLSVLADPISTVNVQNNTTCEVIDFIKHKTAPGLTFFSFYYNKDKQLTYYSAIAKNTSGPAAIGPNPYITPTEPAIILGFSPDPNYTAGMLVSSVPPPGVYVYQLILTGSPTCTEARPCLYWSMENPCN